MQSPLTQKRLKALLSYNAKTGEFFWRQRRSNCLRGSVAGSKKENGYIVIRIDGRIYHAHRLSFLYMQGSWPKQKMDHKNRNRADNRWKNLREANNTQNAANSKLRRDNKSGFRGVHLIAKTKKWRAVLFYKNKPTHLGVFKTKYEAARIYDVYASKAFGKFAQTNFGEAA